jgi:uncharacterized protein (DUF2062 family)
MRRQLRQLLPNHDAVRGNRWLAPFQNTLLHPRLWHLNRHSAAGGIAVGLFCGLIPGPLQMLGATLGAVMFRVNLPLALFTTLYTNPFTIVPLYLVAFQIGEWITGNNATFLMPPDYGSDGFMHWLHAMAEWTLSLGQALAIGLPVLAATLAFAGYVSIRLIWRFHLISAWRRRTQKRE